jgi:DNA-binding GntR family transcriptional regulator
MKSNRKRDCLEDLRARILTMAIAPGSDLDEIELAEAYGISRTPLREVLQRLAGEGYVDMLENRGAKVASMDLPVMRTFFRSAPLIYCSIARLAAESRTTEQLDRLKDCQRRFARAVGDARADEMALENHRFHRLIGEMAADPYLLAALNRMLVDHTRLGQMFYRPSSPAESLAIKQATQHHDAMIVAIEAAEGDVMVDLTLQHWDLSRDRLDRFVRPDPLPLDVVDLAERRNAI